MSDPLGRPIDRVRSSRLKRGPVWAAISISLDGAFGDRAHRTIRVSIDCRRVGYLLGNSPRVFRVEPGEHIVSICYPKNVSASVSVALGPGDQITLVCGRREEWIQFWSAVNRRYFALGISSYLIAALGWIFFPLFREAVASLVIRSGVQGELLSMIYALVGTRFRTGAVLMSMWYFPVGVLMMAQTCRASKRLHSQVGDPLFLTKESP